MSYLEEIISASHLGRMTSQNFECANCKLEKPSALLFNKSDSISSEPFDLAHLDEWSPTPIITISGF